ncbi:MAG: hypothetical protein V4675_03890 [Verrucomicrobiota bacterium]
MIELGLTPVASPASAARPRSFVFHPPGVEQLHPAVFVRETAISLTGKKKAHDPVETMRKPIFK